jgi:hypothetical protein
MSGVYEWSIQSVTLFIVKHTSDNIFSLFALFWKKKKLGLLDYLPFCLCPFAYFYILSGVRLSPLLAYCTSPQMIDDGDCGAIGGMEIGRGNRSTRRKSARMSVYPPQIPHDQIGARTRAASVGNQRLTAWAMARPRPFVYLSHPVILKAYDTTLLSVFPHHFFFRFLCGRRCVKGKQTISFARTCYYFKYGAGAKLSQWAIQGVISKAKT